RLAGLRVEAEHGQAVRVLVGRNEERTGRVDVEVPRRAALGRLDANRRQTAVRRDGEAGDAVVAAVGAVDEPAVGVDDDLGRRVVAAEVGRQRGHRLTGGEHAAGRIVVAGGQLRGQAAGAVGPLAARV